MPADAPAPVATDDCDPWFDPLHPMNVRAPWRPTISELEAILNSEEEQSIEILPNGEVRAIDGKPTSRKPLTMRENLGGEYA